MAVTTAAASASGLPNPCKLLNKAEAEATVDAKLMAPTLSGDACTFNSSPTATTTAQVFLYVSSSTPQTLLTDKRLHHHFWNVPHVGDQAVEEEWNIFARKGSVWVTISIVRLDAWPSYKDRLVTAAREAVSHIGQVVRPKARNEQLRAQPEAAQTVPVLSTITATDEAKWSGKELRYGGSIGHYPGITYQPDVVVIGGGANAIRAVSSDQLTWTITASARGASKLRVGSIMLATTLAAGRVVKLERTGSNVQVTLEPMALTDVIQDGDFDSTRPVPLAQPLVFNGASPQSPPAGAAPPDIGAMANGPTPATPAIRVATGTTGAGASAFKLTRICCSGGIGVHIGYDSEYGRLSAAVQLVVDKPSVTYAINITGGHIKEAELELHGAGALSYYLWGATLKSDGDVKSVPIEVPGSVTIPLVGPLAVTITQSFDLSMQLVGRATLKSTGEYKISGGIGFKYTDSGGVSASTLNMSTEVPMTENTLSLSVGQNAISLGWSVRLTVGLGIGVLAAGVWAQFTPGLAMEADGGGLTSLKFGCVKLSLNVTSKFGAGWELPNFVVKPINAILGVFHVAPIPRTGGPSWGPYTVWKPPQAQYCPPRKSGQGRALWLDLLAVKKSVDVHVGGPSL